MYKCILSDTKISGVVSNARNRGENYLWSHDARR